MIKAIKIAILYWLQQALRLFCPHDHCVESQRHHALVCPTCALAVRVKDRLSELCGMQAIYKIRKCDLCFDPLDDQGQKSGVHLACAERENARQDAIEAEYGV
jgi:hypothetical protein